MRCPSCDGLIEESDVQFCPFCGMQIRASSAGKPTKRISTVIGTPHPTPSFDTPPSAGMAAYTPGGYGTSALPISTAATVSLVFGILGWFMAPVICSIIAIVAGHRARREIAASNGRLGGNGRATAGIIMGYIQLALIVFLCILFFVIFLLSGMAGSGLR
jgi:hypothetical protein